MVIVVGNEYENPSSNPEGGVYISHSANIFGKYMNPSILLLAMAE